MVHTRGRAAPTGRCHYCRFFPADTWDHIVPRASGGCDKDWNLIGACEACNRRKWARFPTCVCARCLWARYRWERGDRQPVRAVRKELRKARLERRAQARVEEDLSRALAESQHPGVVPKWML